VAGALIDLRGVRKDYGGLRPLRLAALSVGPAERVAITGLDAPSAEILVNILTGATLPDEGEVHIFGRATSSISDADDWLATLDRIGMVSPRAMLAEDFTVAQGIAMAFTLSLDPVPETVAADVARLADTTPLVKARCRLARALATAPPVLLLEHANALVPGGAPEFGRDIAALAKARSMAVIALTADETFANAVAERVLALDAATGQLKGRGGWRAWWR
jgi:ABC-type polar amino acid transport system ATPase subunit